MNKSPISALKAILFAAVASALLAFVIPASATVLSYQTSASFNTAITGWAVTTTNFDNVLAGTIYSTGNGPPGSGFTLSLSSADSSVTPTVGNTFATTSGSNYLGLNNPDTAFEAGDVLTFSFAAPVRAFGLYVITGTFERGNAGDISLIGGGTSVGNSATPDLLNIDPVSDAYFLGLVSNSGGFSSVTLNNSIADPNLLLPITVDNVMLASPVPEPSSAVLMFIGLLGLGAASRYRARPNPTRPLNYNH
jgi:hypothetical protein